MIFNQQLHKEKIFKKILFFNIIVFILINSLTTLLFLFSETESIEFKKIIINNLGASSNTKILLQKPWTIITHMFVHFNIFHLFFNMCYLYFSGKIFINYLSEKNLISVYIMGGLTGFLLYLYSTNTFPTFEHTSNEIALGASASALAILVAVSTYIPNLPIKIFTLGNIKLKYIAIVLIMIDFLSITKGNSGGHIAHIGGAFYGWAYIVMKKRNLNLGYFIDKIILFCIKKTPYTYKKENDYEYNARKKKEQKEIDMILDKISRSGYDSLSQNEKQTLFNQK